MKKTGHALFLTLLMVAGPSYSTALTVEPQKRALLNLDQGSLKKTPQQGGQQIIQGGITAPTPQQGEKSSPKETLAPRSSMTDYAKRAASAISSAIFSPIQWMFQSESMLRNCVAAGSSMFLAYDMALVGGQLFTTSNYEALFTDSNFLLKVTGMGVMGLILSLVHSRDQLSYWSDWYKDLEINTPYFGATRDGLLLSDLNPETVRILENRIARLEFNTGAISEYDKKMMASYLKNWVSISDIVYKTLIKNREKLPGFYRQYDQCLKAMYPKYPKVFVKDGRFSKLRHHQEELHNTIHWLNMQHDALRHTFDEITKKLDIFLDKPGLVSKWGLKEFKDTYDLKSSKIRAELVSAEWV